MQDPRESLAAPRWTVLDYDERVLLHRASFHDALSLLFDIVSGMNDTAALWPMFSLAKTPIEGARADEPGDDGIHRLAGVSEAQILERGIVVDVRDAVAGDPELDVAGAAECIYGPFRNIDLCDTAYRDLAILMDWPADRVNHMAELDPKLEAYLRRRHAAELAAGEPVHLVFDRARLTHLDDLHMWVIRQIFYFHACPIGHYAEPDQVYGFSGSRFVDRMVLAFGCAPHAHEMAWGIGYGIEEDLEVEADLPGPSGMRLTFSERFERQVAGLVAGP